MMEDGSFDSRKGKNLGLGRLRKALGQNDPGVEWYLSNLVGGMAKVHVSHRMYEGEVYDEIRRVEKA